MHVAFQMPYGEKCFSQAATDKGFNNYVMSFEIFCDPSIDKTAKPDLKIDDSQPCNPKVTFAHSAGCPAFRGSDLLRYLSHHSTIVGLVLIAFGFVSTFFGSKFYPHMAAFIGGALTFLLFMTFASLIGTLRAVEKYRKPTTGESV